MAEAGIGRVERVLPDAAMQWIGDYLGVFEDGRRLARPRIGAVRIAVPSDRSFTEYATAKAHLGSSTRDIVPDLPWRQALVDVSLDYAIASDSASFEIDPALAHLGIRTTTVLRFLPPHGAERAFTWMGNPGRVVLDPHWYQAARRFVELGFTHILGGIDHLLFVLCLVIPVRRVRSLILVATSFTVAHSITLAASALGFAPDALWFPPLIEMLVALSIVYMALENIVGARVDRRWIVAFAFGLVHGFAFSFALRESMQFGGRHLAASLLAFNVGVEAGQLVVIAIAIPLLAILFTRVQTRMATIILSAFVAHTAWHWMLERASVLAGYRFPAPSFDAAFAISAMRLGMFAIVLAAAAWALSAFRNRLAAAPVAREVGAE